MDPLRYGHTIAHWRPQLEAVIVHNMDLQFACANHDAHFNQELFDNLMSVTNKLWREHGFVTSITVYCRECVAKYNGAQMS